MIFTVKNSTRSIRGNTFSTYLYRQPLKSYVMIIFIVTDPITRYVTLAGSSSNIHAVNAIQQWNVALTRFHIRTWALCSTVSRRFEIAVEFRLNKLTCNLLFSLQGLFKLRIHFYAFLSSFAHLLQSSNMQVERWRRLLLSPLNTQQQQQQQQQQQHAGDMIVHHYRWSMVTTEGNSSPTPRTWQPAACHHCHWLVQWYWYGTVCTPQSIVKSPRKLRVDVQRERVSK